MGFYYDKNSDQERMIKKFERTARNNFQEMSESHPDFQPHLLPLAEQFKYWERKNAEKRLKTDAAKDELAKVNPVRRHTHY